MNVYCNYHNKYGKCLEDDYMDSKEGRNPSGMVRVTFEKFTQAVPIHTLRLASKEKDEKYILNKYHVDENANLSYFEKGTYGVDCWFDSPQWREHRCLSIEDFEILTTHIQKNMKNDCELNSLENQSAEC